MLEIVVKGRNVEVPEHFRVHVADKLSKSERYDSKIIRVDVELSHEANPRQSKKCQRVQLTLVSKGPVVRAEAGAESFYAALDAAVTRLETQLRRGADRRHQRQHSRTPILAVAATAGDLINGSATAAETTGGTELPAEGSAAALAGVGSAGAAEPAGLDGEVTGAAEEGDGPGRVVRIKDHPGDPITVDQALLQMELVGHDFYLFNDVDTARPSVVYRRQGFDYGLLRLT